MLLRGYLKLKRNAAKFKDQTVSMVCIAKGKTEQGEHDDFYVLMYANKQIGKQRVLDRLAFSRFDNALNLTPNERELQNWLSQNLET